VLSRPSDGQEQSFVLASHSLPLYDDSQRIEGGNIVAKSLLDVMYVALSAIEYVYGVTILLQYGLQDLLCLIP